MSKKPYATALKQVLAEDEFGQPSEWETLLAGMRQGLTPLEAATLIEAAKFQGDRLSRPFSQQALASRVGRLRNQVARTLRTLEESGYLVRGTSKRNLTKLKFRKFSDWPKQGPCKRRAK